MNKKIIFIFVLTIIALVVLYLYSFGPLAGKRIANKSNPESLRPTLTEKVLVNNATQPFNDYHNKDLKENYYTIKFPQDWQIQAGKSPGSYFSSLPNGDRTVELMDVPDNTTLELYVLSQDEPNLKNSLKGYQRIDYQNISVNNNDAYQLIYTSEINGETFQTVRAYISGQDHAAVITFSSKQQNYKDMQSLFSSIINSFKWENT